MKRRDLIALGVGTAAVGLTACQNDSEQQSTQNSDPKAPQKIKWKLVTSWPKNFPGLGVAPERLAQRVAAMTNHQFEIEVYGAGQLAPALEVFDTVSQGSADMGHSAAYYWKGKMGAAPFFTSVPFGFNAQEMNGWITAGGGLKLWHELYQPYGVIPFPGGNTGVQMAGWFNKEIHSLDDIKGLKMRIPGLAGEVWKRAGGIPVTLPGAELFTSLQTGAIDATEWVGPYNDLAFGLHQAAKYYYSPGWHEPGPMLEFSINEQAYLKLPTHYQEILKEACLATNQSMLDEYTANNQSALQILLQEHKVELRALPEEVIHSLKDIAEEVILEVGKANELSQKIYASFTDFKEKVISYHRLTEQAYFNAR